MITKALRILRKRVVVRVPVAPVLAAIYAWTAIVLSTKWNVDPATGLANISHWFAVVCAVFVVWHLAGFYGYIGDGPRKIGYLLSGAFLGGLAVVLFNDQVTLSAGYATVGGALALLAYWKYPRRHEAEDD